ncbi:GNAT family N-acetyltransferase [Jannaschia aquimarina]|uniref:Acetyltransferase (GNAT) family protein n=1 Tax=Jannaschia aquimarina TaxID=935700 RepID=A0A0D1EQN4_9RHOB|nr:GNAT family N-acetyltransferase [Jannaschia aquimarina]KIT17945.1 Acetyltransferase (GNAT) family protein [Jannaschia aquimarina]SNT08366.1 hypothetical protein SAMN05421775_105171 [Jannaschia aquimarina]
MIRYRNMIRPELDLALDWAAAEGWNPGLDDADAFWAADPDGFFVADEDGRPVAAISVVTHSERFAFLGLYICLPSHRGLGTGLGLWTHALAHAGDRTVGLDGVPDQQANYARSGFAHAGGAVRHVGRPAPRRSDRVRPALAADRAALVALEAAASGWSKPAYMEAWFTGAPTRTTHLIEEGGEIAGAVTLRTCREGTKIGPLIARDAGMAADLLHHAAATVDTELTVDVPQEAEAFAGICVAEGMVPGFSTARMYRGNARPAPSGEAILCGVATLEIG